MSVGAAQGGAESGAGVPSVGAARLACGSRQYDLRAEWRCNRTGRGRASERSDPPASKGTNVRRGGKQAGRGAAAVALAVAEARTATHQPKALWLTEIKPRETAAQATMAELQKGSAEHNVPFSDVSHIHGMHMSFVLGLRHEGSGEPKERPRPLRRKVGKEKKAGGAMERLQQQLDALRKQLAGLQASVDGATHQLEDTRDHIESSERRAEDTTDDLEEATEERDQAQGEVDVLKAEHERLKKEIEREESTILRLLRERSGDPALEMPEVTFGAEDRRAFKHAGQWAWSTLQSKSCWSCCLNDKRNSLGCAPVMNRLIHCEKSARRTKRSYRPRTAKT